jgi:hypothetical protein
MTGTALLPQLAPGRACGSCMMCCKVPAVEELGKPPGVWCVNAAPGHGCKIYADRPGSCRAFYCLWMQDAGFGPEWKPEKSKFVLYPQRNGVNLQVAVDPSFANAWTKPPYYAWIKRWAMQHAPDGRFVFVRIGERLIVALPDRDQDLGRVDLTDDVVMARRMTAAGPVYEAEVRRGTPA